MTTHRYFRAYMAGITVPTILMVIGLIAFFVTRFILQEPFPIERVIIFPMVLVPSLFGLWNMLYARLSTGRYLPLGFHGALLPIILIPLGATGAVCLEVLSFGPTGILWFNAITIPYAFLVPWFIMVLIIYYLLWKYLVGFCNRTLEVA